ncbi:methylenetetrahydrofolate reductase [NAD(P)H] [Ponticoccus sp. SC2-23]|uniref:methylenetetrahydrofolate reductase [NAD(P)H] n=1 Tax=Alexandriicola marinus TaxID=2081710 RepID=UPI000FDCA0E3|nr:methylenetetrahydrofolate reductase [NAD(P)H] [Alexandriicola marinus]MBM1221640.1 methylenetetrahydrofolate reductase [NAD(P)H] [Ponticoccus sp. SC6-9]MBM1226681.1 methylenetetrahydrofolate reductase [NAD(P)H] [Ponticoccus sp. SC6-15]MBM1230632.1 methylenetetrahydrofolate reductase [NAD(P)H] [Ponticoccus sp. SC6-38]MBM1235155.1 methylenetetrahydrofolate reductase [NAD(P)H] [Ponticoccus sp. SC6-45]MBM1239653.1 methylenetetrahydrofolate reductase [NAD(P)H] [Ponticoccus sp. SC6-49]MBM1243435
MSVPSVSFEFFPPKSLEGSFRLWDCVQTLAPLAPEFVSVTYGAGGTTRTLTHEAVATIHKTSGLRVAAHLTCVDATKAETMEIAEAYAEARVSEIVALRGDPPKGQGKFTPAENGFSGSVELIEALSAMNKFRLRVGAYPEKHPDAADNQADIDHLKRKIDAGAHSAITQFFFEAETFFRFRDACVKAGIDAPIIPGILPIENWSGAKRFAQSCGTSIPAVINDAFENATRDGTTELLATAVATELCDELLQGGVEHLHFYTLNRPELTRDVCHALGIMPKASLQEVA